MNHEHTMREGGAYRDRRAALLVFGILEIVLGIGAWMIMALMLFGATMAARQGASMGSMVPGVLIYGLGGLLYIVLGIGSLRARRWARALWWVVSLGWLLCGLLGGLMALFWVPSLFKNFPAGQAPPPQALAVVFFVIAGFFLIVMIAIPLCLFLFYRSPHVKATCEAAQTEPSWTDACPLPVLASSLWLGVTSLMLVVMPIAYGGLFPCFGVLVPGLAGVLLWLLVAGLALGAAVGLYRLQAWGWWLGLGVFLALGLTTVLTYSQPDNLQQLYQGMGLPAEQLEQMARMGFMRPGFMVVSTLGGILPFLGLLLWAGASMRSWNGGASGSDRPGW